MRTNGDGPSNYPLCCSYAQRRESKFSQIRGNIYPGTMFAPMQGAYEIEAKEMECLKMLTLGWCEERTYENGPANNPLCGNCDQGREWKFAQIHVYIKPGTTLAPMQGAYEKETKEMEA